MIGIKYWFIIHFLGEIPVKHYLFGKHYPTDRLRKRIDKVSNSIMENGLYEWYLVQYKYLNDLKIGFHFLRQYNKNDDLHTVNMEQMIRPFYLCIGLLIMSIFVFIGEIIVFKWKSRRDRNY